MHTRLTMLQAQAGRTSEVLRIFQDSITPSTKQQKGLRQIFLFTKPNSDQVVWLSFWATETDLQAADNSGFFKEQIEKVKDLLTGPPVTDMYEVTTDDRPPRFQLWRSRSRALKPSSS